MSKNETWRTREYWNRKGGLLIEEFKAVKRTPKQGRRLIDGLIVLDNEKKIHNTTFIDIEGKDVIVVQTKANRLGMSLLGQTFFSRELIKKFNPKSIKAVAICSKSDQALEKCAAQFDIEVVVIEDQELDS